MAKSKGRLLAELINSNGSIDLATTSLGGDFVISDNIPKVTFTDTDTSTLATITANSSNLTYTTATTARDHTFKAGASELMILEGTGNVGIGTNTPVRPLQLSTTTGGSIIHLTDNSTGHTATDGVDIQQEGTLFQILNREAGDIRFGTSATERMRLNSAGSLLIGSTADSGSNRHYFQHDGFFRHVRSGQIVGVLDRHTSDGDILLFRQDGTTVGSVGAKSDDVYIVTGDTGIRFNDGNDQIWPVNASGASRDGAIDLGNSNVRFKDLHLSGTANVGGVTLGSNDRIQGTGMLFVGGSSATVFEVGVGSEKMRLTSTGLGIGVQSPSKKLHLQASDVGSGSGEVAIKMTVPASLISAQNEIRSGVTSGTNPYISFAVRETPAPYAVVERVRITTDGYLLVGKTDSSFTTNGVEIRGGNLGARVIRSNAEPMVLHRQGSDGEILNFYKASAQVGSIGVIHGNNLFIGGTSHSGLQFGGSIIYPTGGTGSANDATVDLGGSSTRFKDLHLSGSISSGNITTTGYIRGPSTFTIDPAAHGDNTGTLVIAGNLQVDGTTTTINSTTLTVDDKNIVLAQGAGTAAAANAAGITIDGAGAVMQYLSSGDEFHFNKDIRSDVDITATGQLAGGSLSVDTVSINGSTYATSGNMVFDSANDIILDVDGGNVMLKDDSVWFGNFNHNGNNLKIQSKITNGHIVLEPNGTGNVNIYSDTVAIQGTEGESAKLMLQSDEADDNADIWTFEANTSNVLGIGNHITGSYVDHLTITPNSTIRDSVAAFKGKVNIDNTLEVGVLTSGLTGNMIINSEGGNPPGLIVKSRTNRARINVQDNDTSGYIIAENSVFSLGFYDQASNNNLNIKSGGLVGIGENDPQFNLQLGADNQGLGAITTNKQILLNIDGGFSTTNSKQYKVAGFVGTTSGGTDDIFGSTYTSGEQLKNFYLGLVSDVGYFNSSRFAIVQGGAERFNISQGGNVGIGQSTPLATLHVGSGAGSLNTAAELFIPNNDALMRALKIGHGSSVANITTDDSTKAMTFSAVGGERMRIHTNGNIAINHTSAPHTLTVKGTISRLNSSGIQVTNLQTNNDSGQIAILNSSGVQKVLIDSNGGSTFNGGAVYFTGGNVGIGTSSPSHKLHVQGTPRFELTNGGLIITKTGGGSSTNSDYMSALLRTDTAGYHVTTNNGGFGSVANALALMNHGDLILATAPATGGSANYPSGRIMIKDTGNVGIGTSSPGATLHTLARSGTTGLLVQGAASNNIVHFARSNGVQSFIINSDGKTILRRSGSAGTVLVFEAGAAQAGGVQVQSTGLGIGGGAQENQIFLKTDGNVGIGTTAPNARLEVRNSTTATDTIIASAGLATAGNYHELILGDSRNYAVGLRRHITQSNPGWLRPRLDFIVQDQNTYLPADREVRMSIKDNGNVGIGITNPTTQLHMKHASGPTLMMTRTSTNTSGEIGQIVFGNGDWDSSMARIVAIQDGTNDGARLEFKTQYNSTQTEQIRMVIKKDGLIGIGTPAPQGILHVAQSRTSGGDLWTTIGAGNAAALHIQNTGNAANTNAVLYFRNSSAEKASIGARFVNQSTGETELRFGTTNSSGASYERMRLDGDGKLGIGFTDPSGSLHVTAKDNGGADVFIVAQNTTNNRISGYKILDEGGNIQGLWRYDNGGNYASLSIGTAAAPTTITLGESSTGISFTSVATSFNSGKVATIRGETTGTGHGNLAFDTFQGGSGGGERMVILADGRVGIGGTPLESDTLTVTTAGATGSLRLVNSNTGSGSTKFVIENSSITPAANDYIGEIQFIGKNTAGNANGAAYVSVVAEDVTNGSYDSSMNFSTLVAGYIRNRMRFTPTQTVFNEDSRPLNFRVESNNNDNMIHVDGTNDRVGIGRVPATHPLEVQGHADFKSNMTITGNVGIGQTSFGANGKLQVTGGISTTGNSEIRQSTNADGNTLRFLGTQFVAGVGNSHSYSYSGGGLIASVSPSGGQITLDVGANNTSGHRLKVVNAGNGIDGSLQYLSGTTRRFYVDSSTGKVGIGVNSPDRQLHVGGSIKVGDDNAFEDTGDNFYGGVVFQTPIYTEYQYVWNGTDDHETNLYTGSYFMAEIVFTQHQTNGGTDINRHFVGKWANNHTHHELETIHDSGSTWSMTTSMTATDHSLVATGVSGTAANGRLRIVETYGSGSYSKSTLTVRVYTGSISNITHTYG